MIPRGFYLLSAVCVLTACARPAAERVRTGVAMLADSDRQAVRPGQPAAVRVEEAPLYKIDPSGPPAAMTADTEQRAIVAQTPRPITEEPRPR